WGYSVENGSTSIWERWNSFTREGGFGGVGENNAKMNSFSHYAFGSVAEWMFRFGLGIETDGPGFKKILIKPQPNARMKTMSGSYKSINGLIHSGWEVSDHLLSLTVTIPVNTTARIIIPVDETDEIMLNGEPLT